MAHMHSWSQPPPFWDYMAGFDGPPRGHGPQPWTRWSDFDWTQQGPGFGPGRRHHHGPPRDVFFDHFEESDLTSDEEANNANKNSNEKTPAAGTETLANESSDPEARSRGPGARRGGRGGMGMRGRGFGMGGRGRGGMRGMGRHGHAHHHHGHRGTNGDEAEHVYNEKETFTPIGSEDEMDSDTAAQHAEKGAFASGDEKEGRRVHGHGHGHGHGRGDRGGRGGMRGRGRGGMGFGGRRGGMGGPGNVRVHIHGGGRGTGRGPHEHAEGPWAGHAHGHGHGHGPRGLHGRRAMREMWMNWMRAQAYGPFGGMQGHFGGMGMGPGPAAFCGMPPRGPFGPGGPHGMRGPGRRHGRRTDGENSADEARRGHGSGLGRQMRDLNLSGEDSQQEQQQPQPQSQMRKGRFPAVDVFDGPDAYEVHASVPGASKDGIEVSWDAEKSQLVISGTIARPGDEAFLQTLSKGERKIGDFKRRVRLGDRDTFVNIDAEGIKARVEDGVLRIEVPKVDDDIVEVDPVVVA